MIAFFIKKSFFDGWDHLFALMLLNLGFVAAVALGVVLPGALGLTGIALDLLVSLALAGSAVWFSTCVHALVGVSDFGNLSMQDFGKFIKAGFVPGIQVGLFSVACFLILSIGLPFYLQLGGIMGALAAGVVFWCSIIAILALQYYLPLRARLGGGLRKNLRKSFLLFFDNPLFSLFLFLYASATIALSFFLAFLMPGFAGVALAQNVALRLRLYKYDWIEAHPEEGRRGLPWDELLAEDRELVGKRTLKGMFFPWKE